MSRRSLFVVLPLCFLGCGSSDPLQLKGAKSEHGDVDSANSSSRGDRAADSGAAVVAPTLVDPPLSETQPGTPPEELVALIRIASEHLAKNDRLPAIESLVDPQSLATQKTTAAAIAEQMPKINAVLMAGTLRQALKSPARVGAEGSFVLFEVSDTTHARFNRINGKWRLSDNLRPDGGAPGLSYDDAGPHAAFLLRKLAGVEALGEADSLWSAGERPIVEALRKQNVGFARGQDSNGKPVTAVVFKRSFAGDELSFPQLKRIVGMQVVALYETKVSDAGFALLKDLPDLRALRVLRDVVASDTIRSLGTLRGLTTLSVTALQREFTDLKPLGELVELERLELNNLSFDPADLDQWTKLQTLKRLDLARSTVDDATLQRIPAFRNLEQLRILADAVSFEGVEKLQRAVPNLFIDW